MVDCFKCKKELERIDKFSSENLESMFGISIPSSISEDDRLCGGCVRHLLEPQQDTWQFTLSCWQILIYNYCII